MKFSAIVGNPPYQAMDGGGRGDAATPLYDKVMDLSQALSPSAISLIMPARWYSGGRGLDEFRESMLHDDRLELIDDYPETGDCFEGVNIRGGICRFLWNARHHGPCTITNHLKGECNTMKRSLLEGDNDIFIRYNASISILNKVRALGEATLRDDVSVSRPFGLRSNFSEFVAQPEGDATIALFRHGDTGYVRADQLLRGKEMVPLYKVIIAKASPGGDEVPHHVISRPLVAGPQSACSETYLVIKTFDNEVEAQHLADYAKTRFFRFMMLLAKNGQNLSRDTYRFVPHQDYHEAWDDQRLFEKYDISAEEQSFIESVVK